MNKNDLNNQRGNVLFIILITVVLFAALGYTITSTGRGSGNISAESEQIAINQMLGYMNRTKEALVQLSATNEACFTGTSCFAGFGPPCTGYTGTISFESPKLSYDDHYAPPNAPVDKSCNLFDPAGGKFEYEAPPDEAVSSEYGYTGIVNVRGIGTSEGDGSSYRELLMVAHVTRNMCLMINDKFGITNPGGNPPSITYNSYQIPFEFDYIGIGMGFAVAVGFGGGGQADELYGHEVGCYSSPQGLYYFYYTLVAR